MGSWVPKPSVIEHMFNALLVRARTVSVSDSPISKRVCLVLGTPWTRRAFVCQKISRSSVFETVKAQATCESNQSGCC